jgi:hypothetical protein
MCVVFVAWSFFRFDYGDGWILVQRLFDLRELAALDTLSPYYVAPIFLLLGLLVVDHALPAYGVDARGYPVALGRRSCLVAQALLLPAALVFSGEQLPFIYFEF